MKSVDERREQGAILQRDEANRICLVLAPGVGTTALGAKLDLLAIRRRLVGGVLRRLVVSRRRPKASARRRRRSRRVKR